MRGARRFAGVALTVAMAVGACGGERDDAGGAGAQPAGATAQASTFVRTLRAGGNVIAFRHAITDQSHQDEATFRYDQCARQRNLSAAGRAQARAIGRAFRRLQIPIGGVLASPYCRTRETARLAFGRVTATPDLLSTINVRQGEDADTLDERFRALLRRAPARGTNTVLVSHGIAIDAATGVNLDEGDAAVFRRDGSRRGFRLVRTMTAAAWTALARREGSAASTAAAARPAIREFRVPAGSGPHDVAPARDGTVWFTAQASGHLGRLDPRTGRSRMVALGDCSVRTG